jgi:TPR repeat protein
MPELTPANAQTNVLPALSSLVASITPSNHDFNPPAAARTASIGLSPVGTRGAANPATSAGAAQRPALLPMPPQTVSPFVAPRPSMAAEEEPVIAAKMKIGVELMTYGEVTAARTMFQRAAEAGDGAGAFALAETYDPLVLGGLRLREAITPDLALARTWYERARDLGSLEARDRISRLAQLPQ